MKAKDILGLAEIDTSDFPVLDAYVTFTQGRIDKLNAEIKSGKYKIEEKTQFFFITGTRINFDYKTCQSNYPDLFDIDDPSVFISSTLFDYDVTVVNGAITRRHFENLIKLRDLMSQGGSVYVGPSLALSLNKFRSYMKDSENANT